MRLGEQICKLRSEKNMSQGDLAEALGVSRQSISKWETNSAVPELDKLIKLSEIFGVTLDELVLDRQTKTAEKPVVQTVYVEKQASGKKIVGTILCCFSALIWLLFTLLGDMLAGLVLALPFLSCGLICLLAQKRPGLWCGWTVYLFLDFYLRYATGVSWQFAFWGLFLTGSWAVHLAISWCQVLALGILIGFTVRSFRHVPVTLSKRSVALLAGGWGVYLLTLIPWLAPPTEAAQVMPYRAVSGTWGWFSNCLLMALLTVSIRMLYTFLKNRRQKHAL